MKYDIRIRRIGFDGTMNERIILFGVSEAMALKVLDVYGHPGYDVKISGYSYTKLNEGEENECIVSE